MYDLQLRIKTEKKELPDRLRTKLDGLAAIFDLDRGDCLREHFDPTKGEYIIDYFCVDGRTKRRVTKIIKERIPEIMEVKIEVPTPVLIYVES